MALRVLKSLAKQSSQLRQIHQSTSSYGLFDFLNKPVARDEDLVVGYQKIVADAAKVGEDPLDTTYRDVPDKVAGSGTRADPFIIPARQTRRYVQIEPPAFQGGTYPGFWVTLEDGGRCPFTARYYKLDYNPTDKWGVDELDLFNH